MTTLLTTRRLTLRRFAPSDLEDLVILDADPMVMRFITGGEPTSHEELRDDVLPHWMALYETNRWGFWAAEYSTNFVGWFHLRPGPTDPHDEPELGYRLLQDVWGQGLATEGSRALIDLAFGELGARRVHAESMAVNTGSRRVMEKSGMHFVRLFHADWPVRIPGDEHGDVEYEITREQWSLSQTEVLEEGPARV